MVKDLKQSPELSIHRISAIQPRIESIDILRGVVMIIMALDHVRDFFHREALIDSPTNLATTTPLLFLTRWITHYCAPVFVFLSGISASLAGQKKTKNELSIYLVKRGLWLIIAELIIINFSLSFDPGFSSFFLQVIWVIGCSMILLGLMIKAPVTVIAFAGLLIILGHNALDYFQFANEKKSLIMDIFLRAQWTEYPIGGGRTIKIAYAVLPWTAVMLLGYACGSLYTSLYLPKSRRKILIAAGIGMVLLFILLRLPNIYGDPSPWQPQKNFLFTLFSFINTSKYPPSLLYLCMTIGPALILLGLLENRQLFISKFLMAYGKVPFFYYVLHFYLIHLLCLLFFFGSGHPASEAIDPKGLLVIFGRPVKFGFDLWVVYLVWFFIVALLYYPCKWFGFYKKRHRHWWLSYI